MKSKKAVTIEKDVAPHLSQGSIFEKKNLLFMVIGAVVMIIGFMLMAGGRSEDPNVFDPKEVYSTTRITIAPILILVGLVIEVLAIFYNPKD